jgi:hypothetical protein
VSEPHPRDRSFMTSAKLSQLRNELYELLHDEIRRTMDVQPAATESSTSDTFTLTDGEQS